MKVTGALWLLGAALAMSTLSAQEYIGARQEFLTDSEIDLIREAQEPNQRIELYLHFAKLRLELVRQQLEVEKPGRSQQIHRNLEQYGRIIETIDVVVDDALDSGSDVSKGMEKLTSEEEKFLVALQAIADNPGGDYSRYEFVLEDAIEITEDSIELSQMDLGVRTADVREADERELQKREATMTPERKEEVTKVRKAEAKKEAERKRKRPSLLRRGETLKKR